MIHVMDTVFKTSKNVGIQKYTSRIKGMSIVYTASKKCPPSALLVSVFNGQKLLLAYTPKAKENFSEV